MKGTSARDSEERQIEREGSEDGCYEEEDRGVICCLPCAMNVIKSCAL